tara:strand:- start:4006 stop:5523 length:1518 start_codon:yes stop_codon:yes gene_type:complete
MSKKIEILENTLLKLLVRRGTDADRQLITLDQGELGYTTDSKRLFVGDGSTQGGQVAGNKFLGSSADHTTVTEGTNGDFAFNTTTNTLYSKNGAGWDRIAVIFEAADGSIVVDEAAGTLKVGTLSASNFASSTDLTGNSIEMVSGQISLSSTQIKTNRVTPNSTSHLFLPQNMNINAVNYQFPTGGLGGANSFLRADASGNLTWSAPESNATLFFNSSSAAIPVGAMVESGSLTSMPTGWLLADGQTVASATYPDLYTAIGTTYGGDATNFQVPDESAAGFVFIKGLPDSVSNPSFKVEGLNATVNGSAIGEGDSFSPIADDVVIAAPIPGLEANDTAGAGTFTTQATYTKFWVTGSGSTGGSVAGGAASTVYGVLSAPIGTSIAYTVGAGATTSRTDGNDSFISIGGTELAKSVGAVAPARDAWATGATIIANGGSSLPTSDYVLGVHILSGGYGGMDTSSGDEEVNGVGSFWGGAGAPGAANHSVGGSYAATADGMVKFEWGM